MKPLYAVLLAAVLTPGLSLAQTNSQPSSTVSPESDWSAKDILSAPVAIVTAPFRVLGKIFKRSPSSPKPTPTPKPAETPAQAAQTTGWVAFAQVQATSTPLGFVSIQDTDAGYALTPHLTVEAGLPIFFTRSPFSEVSNHDWRWMTWILGEPYVDVRYSTNRFGLSITSILTGTIPVSSQERIFTTGRFGGDWFNHAEKNYKNLTPFLNVGVSNGIVNRFIMPRPYSMAKQYQTLGFMSDFEGGGTYKFTRWLAIGASAYAYVPAGPQKVYSRLVAPDYALAGSGSHNRYFNTAFVTQGPTSIDRDNGFSGWVDLPFMKHTTLQVGYTRSIHYALDQLTVMLNFDGSFLFRRPQPQQ